MRAQAAAARLRGPLAGGAPIAGQPSELPRGRSRPFRDIDPGPNGEHAAHHQRPPSRRERPRPGPVLITARRGCWR